MAYIQDKHNHLWYYKDSRTITLDSTYDNFADFVDKSGIEDKEEYESIFNTLYNLYGDTDTKANTTEYLSQWLKFVIENEYEKFSKIEAIWDNEIDKLTGDLRELNQFRIGDIKTNVSDFDKFKSARQTESRTQDLLDKIDQINKMRAPFDKLINDIAIRVFMDIPMERNYD